MPIGWQLILRRVDDAVLVPGVAQARRFSSLVCRLGAGLPLLAFQAAGGHAHVVVLSDRPTAGELARRLNLGLGQSLGHRGALEAVRLRPVHDQAHARNLVRYVLDQRRHHDLTPDPFHEASALPDLLGLRLAGAWMRDQHVQRMPELPRRALIELLSQDPWTVERFDPACLAQAAAAALPVEALVGRPPLVVAARAAAVQVARGRLRSAEVAAALSCPLRTVQRLAGVPVAPELLRAVEGQWRLRSGVAAAGEG